MTRDGTIRGAVGEIETHARRGKYPHGIIRRDSCALSFFDSRRHLAHRYCEMVPMIVGGNGS